MTGGDGGKGFLSEINVTPFVDVMLVLLIIFMVTAPMMIQGVDVSLPEATAEPLESETEQLMVSVDPEGRVFINEVEIAVDTLGQKLTHILQGRADRAVYLKADKDIAYGKVVRVMSEIKKAGVERLGMVTVPVEEEIETR
jgi:biopolymer transport protein TolR